MDPAASSLRRTVVVVTAALGVALLLAWASVAGPTTVVARDDGDVATVQRLDRSPQQQTDDQHRADRSQDPRSARAEAWGVDVVTVLAVLVSLWFLGLLVRGLVDRIAQRLPDARLVVDVDPLSDRAGPDPDAGREALARDAVRQREALDGGDVRDAIVRCWVRLEETAASAGVVRRPSETASELVVRFLHALDVDPRPVAVLARLYHEARFSTHPLGEPARDAARAALQQVHESLRGVRS